MFVHLTESPWKFPGKNGFKGLLASAAERRTDWKNMEDGLGASHLNLKRIGCDGFTRYCDAL